MARFLHAGLRRDQLSTINANSAFIVATKTYQNRRRASFATETSLGGPAKSAEYPVDAGPLENV